MCGVHHLLLLLMDTNILSCLLTTIQNSHGCFPFPENMKLLMFSSFSKILWNINFNCKLKSLQSDWEGEYKYGIAHRISCPHTHEKNGSTERKIRHTLKRVSLLAHASIPRHFWHFAFETTVFLINRLPSPVLKDKSPFDILLKPIPDYKFLEVFGCATYSFIHPYVKHKFAYHSIHCVFLGYSPNHHGYCHLDRHSDCLYAHHVCFDEYYFPFKNTSILGPSPVNSSKITWLVVPVTCSSQNMLSSSSQNHVSIIISKSC